jgi:hypothetical protein
MNATDGATQQTVREFLRDAVRSMLAADGRTWRSLRDVIIRPGALTRAYFDETRARYIHPIELFLLANLIFFVIGGLTRNHMLTTSLQSQLCCQRHSPVAKRMFYSHMRELRTGAWADATRDSVTEQPAAAPWKATAARQSQFYLTYRLTMQTAITRFQTKFDIASEQSARTLVFVMVPLFALIIGLLEFRRGGPETSRVRAELLFVRAFDVRDDVGARDVRPVGDAL